MLPGIYFSPRNAKDAVTSTGYTEPWPRIEQEIPRPEVILSISAHWFTLNAVSGVEAIVLASQA